VSKDVHISGLSRYQFRMGEDMETLLLRVTEAAAQLGISRAKFYELLASGALPSVKVDGCRRIRTADLLEFVENLTESA
jgi:excisionase family DNA binding protein